MRKYFLLLLSGCALLLVAPANAQPELETRVCVQNFPNYISEKLGLRDRSLSESFRNLDNTFYPDMVVNRLSKWRPSQIVTVAFKGGDYQLRKKIADAAMEWTNHANLTLDFGHDADQQAFREWSIRDSSFSADIRITFNDPGGYWSLVGTASSDPYIVQPYQPSMSLRYFDTYLPSNWKGTVLHEFGHALGFEHEHQHPSDGCQTEFRWQDDNGYNPTRDSTQQFTVDSNGNYPGLYRVYGGPPNNWTASAIDRNFKQLDSSSAFGATDFDTDSIMIYDLQAWMLHDGSNSACFVSQQNNDLSAFDKVGASKTYPFNVRGISEALELKKSSLNTILSIENMPAEWRNTLSAEMLEIEEMALDR